MIYSSIIGLCLAATLQSPASADVFSGAAWLRDPVFEGVPVLNLFHRDFEPVPELSGPTHVHTLFRTEIELKEQPVSATLAITGDDYYKFFINDAFIVQGPAPSYHFAHPYFELEIGEHLSQGSNCLASHVYYQGLRNRVWNSADNRSGFMLALDVRYGDGTGERFVTDDDWRYHPLDAFPLSDTIGYQTQYLEHIDMRNMPRGWRACGFDDSAWQAPLQDRQDHQLERQITPPLQLERYDPVKTRDLDGGRFTYDFGMVLVGHTRIRLQGASGQVVTVRHAEELDDEGFPRYDMRANCLYEEHVTLSGDEEVIEFYDYRSFRYMEILNAPDDPEVWVQVRHHPFDETRAGFTSENTLLEDIWTICRNGVQMASQGVYVDCPSREKGQYLGDTLIAARSHLWLTADPSLAKKAIMDYAHSRKIHKAIMAVAPGNFMQEIAEYSLQFPLLVLEYYRLTGDRDTALFAVTEVYDGIFSYFDQYEDTSGLLVGIYRDMSKWVLVDWPQNLRDNYDYEYSLNYGNTVLNAFFYGSLQAAAELQHLLGMDNSAHTERAERLAASFERHLANPDTGLYRDAPGSDHHSLHASAIPLAFGLTAGADKARILEHIAEKRLSCGVYIASFVIEGCFKAGAADLAFSLINSTDERSWHEMLRHGATTCMEAWGPDQKWNTSWLHPWSSSPVYLLGQYVFGLSPAVPGWREVRVAPPRIEGLSAMELTVPLPSGSIHAQYDPDTGYRYTISGDLPVQVDVSAGVPVHIVPDAPGA